MTAFLRLTELVICSSSLMETQNDSLPSVSEAKAAMDAARIITKREFSKCYRSGKGPSAEYKAAYAKDRELWRIWCRALDAEKAGKV